MTNFEFIPTKYTIISADAARDDRVTFDILIAETLRWDDGVVQFELPATAVAVEP